MSSIDTSYLEKCIKTLEKAFSLLKNSNQDDLDYELFRSASIKEFEIILEQCGKLLRKVLKPYYHSSKAVDQLYFKEVFKQCVLRSIISIELCERFLVYRDCRNNTAHEYGVNFAEEILLLLPEFIADSKTIVEAIKNQPDDIKG